MTDSLWPLCDSPDPCTCYADGYAAGKDQGVLRSDSQPRRPAPRRGLGLPTLPGEAGLREEGDDPDGQEFAGLFELVEAWTLDDHDN